MAKRPTPRETLKPRPPTTPAAVSQPAQDQPDGKPSEAPRQVEALLGSSVLPSVFLIDGVQVQLGEIVGGAHASSGLSVEDWNGLEAAEREARLKVELDRRGWVDGLAQPEPSRAAGTVQLYKLDSHRLAGLFYDLMGELEALPGSERATGLVNELGKLRDSTEDLLNGVEDRHRVSIETVRESLADAQPALSKAVPEGLLRIRVRGPQAGRRRAGRQFGPEAQDLDVTPEELELLRADTELAVRQIE